MSFATDYLAQLERFAQRGPMPRVRALHLPPEPAPGEARGEFCALELDDGSLGLSYVLLDDTLARLRALDPTLGLAGADALGLAQRYVDRPGSAAHARLCRGQCVELLPVPARRLAPAGQRRFAGGARPASG